jgi:hypothetical protein
LEQLVEPETAPNGEICPATDTPAVGEQTPDGGEKMPETTPTENGSIVLG